MRGVLGVVAAVALGCTSQAPARPQLVVVVDTDLPAALQSDSHPEISADAVVDTLRIDVLPMSGAAPYDLHTFLVPDVADWPISFGVPTSEGQSTIRLRLRLFRAALSSPGDENGVPTLDPPPEVTVDRVLEVPEPSDVRTVAVTLWGACLGMLPSFGGALATCIDADHPRGRPADGVADVAPSSSRVGTFSGALEAPCGRAGPPTAVCIPGGFSVLGHIGFQGLDDKLELRDSYPLHPVRIRPFFLDKIEFTVGRLRDLAAYSGPLPSAKGTPGIAFSPLCTWTGSAHDSSDDLPINCVTAATAASICQAAGGALPTEAQWEHAARGRGEGRLYPWGDSEATCCTTSASRKGPPGVATECGPGIEAAGSHQAACAGAPGDVSRDGVLDLGGSMVEAVQDQFQPFSAECWGGQGILVDPVCTQAAGQSAARGSYWNGGLSTTAAPFRRSFGASPSAGLRCAYEGG